MEEKQIGATGEEKENHAAMEEEKEIRADSCLVCQWCLTHEVDSWPPADCKICVAKAAALERIKAAGGDSIKAAQDSAARATADVCVIHMLHDEKSRREQKPGFSKRRMRVQQSYIDFLFTRHELKPLCSLPDDYFEKNPHERQLMIDVASTVLLGIEEEENILLQYFKYGVAYMDVDLS